MLLMLKFLFINICYFSHTFKLFCIFIPLLGITYLCVDHGPTSKDIAKDVDVLREEIQFLRTELSVSICVKASGS